MIISFSFSQEKYWLDISESISLADAEKHLNTKGHTVINKSEWLHSLTILTTQEELVKLKNTIIITSTGLVKSFETHHSQERTMDIEMLSENYKLLNLQAFNSSGLTGKGVPIGIIDAGFEKADLTKELSHLFKNKQIIKTKDFVSDKNEDFYAHKTAFDFHGRQVLSLIAGKKDTITSLAFEANYYLARTENGDIESRIEEDNWISAIEWLYKNKVRLVNTSLGYAAMFDDSTENYLPGDMDGKTSRVAKAARIAVNRKNMILVVSAGNMGEQNNWQVLTTPADVKGVISVGAIGTHSMIKQGYSSKGGENLKYIKPDLVCYSPSGTSYSAPIITSMIACILQLQPDISVKKLYRILYGSCNLLVSPNNYVGRGYPNGETISQQLKTNEKLSGKKLTKIRTEDIYTKKMRLHDYPVTVFDKRNKHHVILQYEINKGKELIINKKNLSEEVKFTTIITNSGEVIEIAWQ